jgi:hypothetical protein
VTLAGEPTWGGTSAAPVEAATASESARVSAVTDADGAEQPSTKDLESEVYTARDVHGDARAKLRRKFARARSSMSETSYRRALELARDSGLLSVDECLEGAVAMEWEPLSRPEFSLASIEAAVAEQERAEQLRAIYGTEQEPADPAQQEPAERPRGESSRRAG